MDRGDPPHADDDDRGTLPETPGDATAENLDAVCNLDLSELEYAEVPLASGETEPSCDFEPAHSETCETRIDDRRRWRKV